jgi:hypothetical protein
MSFGGNLAGASEHGATAGVIAREHMVDFISDAVLRQGGTKTSRRLSKQSDIAGCLRLNAVNALEPATKVAGTGGVDRKGRGLATRRLTGSYRFVLAI